MAQFHFYQDAKLTVWERTRFTVDAETEEEALAIARQLAQTEESIDNYDEIVDSDVETLADTIEYMYPADNDGQATVEVYKESNTPGQRATLIATNVEEK